MSYASSEDVVALLGRALSTEDLAMVDRRLAQVERLIRRRIPDLEAKITSGVIAEEDLIGIEADAVLRVVLHGDGLISEADGAVAYQKFRDTDGRLRLTADEWAALGAKPSRMFSVAPGIDGVPLL